MTVKRISLVCLAALLAACATVSRPGGPVEPPVQPVAVFTVQVEPATAVVKVGGQEWATRPDGRIVEEFQPGQVFVVTARADGFVPSDPVTVTMAAGAMPVLKIVLVPVPVRGPPVITISGRTFLADGKPWAPAFVSALNILGLAQAEQAAYLDWVKATGFDGVRVFAGELRPWSPLTPAMARANLPGLLDLLAKRGLAVEVTALTGTATGYDAKAHLTAVADILAGRPGVLLELANEITNGTQDQAVTAAANLRAWGQEIAQPRGLLWAIGATDTDEPCPAADAADRPEVCSGYQGGEYAAGGGSYSTAHLDRGRPTWNNVRRVREIFAIADETGRPSFNNEPMGADELDGRQTGKQRWNDPALFFAMGALDRAFSIGGVHHSEAGRYSVLPGPVQQQCAEAYLAGHRAVDAALGGQVGSYRNIGHQGSPVVGANLDEVIRAYSFIVGNVGVTVAVGMGQNPAIQWGNGWPPGTETASMTGQDGRRAVVMTLRR